jgi:WhiB family transcriptional regulator, redox-sensing transcriptional regulator
VSLARAGGRQAVIGGGTMTDTRTDWRHRAACRDEDPELFFPVTDVGPGARQTAEAKAVCARCPVREQCLRYALDNGLDHGIFGGTSERERRTLTRRARHAA